MFCKICAKVFERRTEYLLHLSVCGKIYTFNRFSALDYDEAESDNMDVRSDEELRSETGVDSNPSEPAPKDSRLGHSSSKMLKSDNMEVRSEEELRIENNVHSNPSVRRKLSFSDDSDSSCELTPKDSRLGHSPSKMLKLADKHKVEKIISKHDCSKTPDENEAKPEAVIKSLRKTIKALKNKRAHARKTNSIKAARILSKKIERYSSLITEIQDVKPDVVRIETELSPDDVTELDSCTSQQSSGGKKVAVGRKQNYCKYCHLLKTNYSRHIETVHPLTNEGQELQKANSLSPQARKKKKQEITDVLRKESNAIWNKKVLEEKTTNPKCYNNLIPVKRRSVKSNLVEDSVTCIHCSGLYKRNRLYVHFKNCKKYKPSIQNCEEQVNSPMKSSPSLKGKVILHHGQTPSCMSKDVSDELKNEVIKHMRNNKVSAAVRSDHLIMKMGTTFHKSRRDPTEKNYVSREMRDLGQLLLKLKELDPEIIELEDALDTTKFNIIISAVEELSKYDKTTGTLGVMSFPYRILTPLNNCAVIVRKERMEEASKSQDRSKVDKINDFIQTISDHWASEIGRLSTRTRKINKSLNVGKIALQEDIFKLTSFIINEYSSVIQQIKENPKDGAIYSYLVDMLLTHIMCLYRRRPVDCKRATLTHYSLLDQHDDLVNMVQDGTNSLTDEELKQCNNFHIFFAPGKNHEIIPIVFTPEMKRAMDVLIEHRHNVGITTDKLFVKPFNANANPSLSLQKFVIIPI